MSISARNLFYEVINTAQIRIESLYGLCTSHKHEIAHVLDI